MIPAHQECQDARVEENAFQCLIYGRKRTCVRREGMRETACMSGCSRVGCRWRIRLDLGTPSGFGGAKPRCGELSIFSTLLLVRRPPAEAFST